MPAATPIHQREEIVRRHESGETLAQIAREMPLSVDCRGGILAVRPEQGRPYVLLADVTHRNRILYLSKGLMQVRSYAVEREILFEQGA